MRDGGSIIFSVLSESNSKLHSEKDLNVITDEKVQKDVNNSVPISSDSQQ